MGNFEAENTDNNQQYGQHSPEAGRVAKKNDLLVVCLPTDVSAEFFLHG
jgi:hypothetical protein